MKMLLIQIIVFIPSFTIGWWLFGVYDRWKQGRLNDSRIDQNVRKE